MATIRTAIELQDNFTGVLDRIIGSVGSGVAAMDNLYQAMGAAVDTSSIDTARNSLNQATAAAQELDSALQGTTIPQWNSGGGVEMFNSTGVARFEQEVQSANAMLNTLNAKQREIAATAARTGILPDAAVADIENLNGRLQSIQQRIQQIESNPLNIGSETVNNELERMRGQLDQAVHEQSELNRAVSNMDVWTANNAYQRLSETVENTERYIRDNVDEQGRFNRAISEGVSNANNLTDTLKGAVAAYATVQTVGKALDLSDTLTSTAARLSMMNDGLQTTNDLQNMIYQSAERARGSYQATADAVSKLGTMAGDAFASSGEVVAFMEQVNKQFTIAGTSASGMDAAMLQLTQAMGSGVLRGEEYNSILEQAPNIIETIANYLDVPKGKLKEMAAEGVITADVIKAAMFAAADETNAKFEAMPKTFGQIATSFRNTALMAFQPVLSKLNAIANSASFQQFVSGVAAGAATIAEGLLMVVELLMSIFSVVSDNWPIISPIIYSIAAALALYYGYLMLVRTAEIVGTGIKAALALASYAHAAATGTEASATAAATAAQLGFNTALLACPITWIVLAVMALVALFFAAIAAVNKFAGTTLSAIGIVSGAIAVAGAFIGNIFVAMINFTMDVFAALWNYIAAFANFFANVFNDPVASIARLFFDLADTILSLLEALAGAIDALFGSNLAGAVSGWRGNLKGWVDSTYGRGEEVMAKVSAEDYHLQRFEYSGAWDAGYNFGSGLGGAAKFDPSSYLGGILPGAGAAADLGDQVGGIGGGVNDIAGNTGAIKDALDITEEDLKYLRDIAEQEAINRYTTAEITIEQTNNNHIRGSMDLDGVVSRLTDAVNEAANIIEEGVHT
nr:MAG TPA: tail tape measure [Caudoviricetes sp.]